jgi:hypothetical protein
MCWACFEGNPQTASYRVCDGCKRTFAIDMLQLYDFVKQWRGVYNWLERDVRKELLCADCAKDRDNLRDQTRAKAANSKMISPEARSKDAAIGAIPVGIFASDNGRDKTMGIACAQIKYGVEAMTEILLGFVYKDDDGLKVKRLTIRDVDETTRCDKCWLFLFECNANEVTQ